MLPGHYPAIMALGRPTVKPDRMGCAGPLENLP